MKASNVFQSSVQPCKFLSYHLTFAKCFCIFSLRKRFKINMLGLHVTLFCEGKKVPQFMQKRHYTYL
jgi:hypothetical protein